MGIQFCRECNNLMNPKVEEGSLIFVCNKCETMSDPENPIISSVSFKKQHNTNSLHQKDLVYDKTLPRLDMKCVKCGNRECIGYIEKSEEKALNFYYVCTKCFFEWTD